MTVNMACGALFNEQEKPFFSYIYHDSVLCMSNYCPSILIACLGYVSPPKQRYLFTIPKTNV